MIRDYNYHNWSKYMIRKPGEEPKSPHFAAVLFETYSTYTPPYDKYDSGSHDTHNITVYFAFPTKELLTQWVAEAQGDKKKFFFFEVKKLGSLEVKVEVETDI